jgi:hypothetical protein
MLTITDPGQPGDYNQDDNVDAADYVFWRKMFGSATALPNDDTPGVGNDDYDRWVANFGESAAGSGGSGTVPEPAAFVIAGIAVFAAAGIGRRCR